MKIIAFLAIYLAGGVALFPLLDLFRPVGISLDQFYSEFYLSSGADVAQRLSLSFIYASVFHLGWAALFSESSKSWVYTTSIKDLCYLAIRCLSFFLHQPDDAWTGREKRTESALYRVSSIFSFSGYLHARGRLGVGAQEFFDSRHSLHRKKNHENG